MKQTLHPQPPKFFAQVGGFSLEISLMACNPNAADFTLFFTRGREGNPFSISYLLTTDKMRQSPYEVVKVEKILEHIRQTKLPTIAQAVVDRMLYDLVENDSDLWPTTVEFSKTSLVVNTGDQTRRVMIPNAILMLKEVIRNNIHDLIVEPLSLGDEVVKEFS